MRPKYIGHPSRCGKMLRVSECRSDEPCEKNLVCELDYNKGKK